MKTIQSIDKAMHILDYIAEHNGQATLTDISPQPSDCRNDNSRFFIHARVLEHYLQGRERPLSLGGKLFQLSLFLPAAAPSAFSAAPDTAQTCGRVSGNTSSWYCNGRSVGLCRSGRTEPAIPSITAVAGETVPYYDSAIGLIIKAANNETIPQEYLTLCNNLARDGYV